MHEQDLSREIAGLLELSFCALADVCNQNVPYRNQRWSPGNRDRAYPKRRKNRSTSHSCSADLVGRGRRHLGGTLGPRGRAVETFAMDAVGSSGSESLHSPLNGVLHGWGPWDASANFVGEAAKVLLYGRRLKRSLDHFIDIAIVWGRICGKTS